ncbi:hypothetical protein QTN47_25810 [Danxiaibacter flavus]|uniref:Outer membrane protein beta-barrel domain-containing protein n=1 Tax=Danxiaibacter flavus TaxID=3049108 RepID=A0ABV3ZM25_9BACT|nr:hypothetical protein QNM32_25810 [Chitinophagaceae bacterium DXS]
MKKLVFIAAVTALSLSVKAQDSSGTQTEQLAHRNSPDNRTFIWSLGVEPSMPIGHFHDYSNFGLGGSLQGEYRPGKRVGITANAGYIDYFGKTVDTISYANFKYWPVMGGLKLYMSDRSYIHGQAGAGFGEKGLGTSFWYGAGIGCGIGKAIDVELRYMGWKQNEIPSNHGTTGGYYGNGPGTTGGTGGGYGGHYSTIGLRLAVKF